MTISTLLTQLNEDATLIQFSDVIQVIEDAYKYTPTSFHNGDTFNQAGTNEGSCKLFYFAKLNNLPEAQTVALFGDYYRKDVLQNPDGSDHANIRNFMRSGWAGVKFEGEALSAL